MLQMYYASTYLLVGDQRFKINRSSSFIRDDQLDEGEFLLKDATWGETKAKIENGELSSIMYSATTFWKKRPYISAAGYYCDDDIPKFFENEETRFSVVRVYVLDEYYTMEDVMKHASADQAVQWFKERGLSVCPLQ